MKKYCPHCKEEHVVSSTYDNNGTLVGFFCNREKLLVESITPVWNGMDMATRIATFVDERLDYQALEKMERSRLIALSKRLAYQLLQTDETKANGVNFAFATYWINEEVKERFDSTMKVGRV